MLKKFSGIVVYNQIGSEYRKLTSLTMNNF